jgi:hypothetical protein
MTRQDFLAASQGDVRLAMARPDPTTATRTRCGNRVGRLTQATPNDLIYGIMVLRETDRGGDVVKMCWLHNGRIEASGIDNPYDLVVE